MLIAIQKPLAIAARPAEFLEDRREDRFGGSRFRGQSLSAQCGSALHMAAHPKGSRSSSSAVSPSIP